MLLPLAMDENTRIPLNNDDFLTVFNNHVSLVKSALGSIFNPKMFEIIMLPVVVFLF